MEHKYHHAKLQSIRDKIMDTIRQEHIQIDNEAFAQYFPHLTEVAARKELQKQQDLIEAQQAKERAVRDE